MSEGMAPVIGDIAEIMIGVQYIGYLVLIGVALLLSLLIPQIPFKKGRVVLGVLCILAAVIIFVWLYAGLTLGLMIG